VQQASPSGLVGLVGQRVFRTAKRRRLLNQAERSSSPSLEVRPGAPRRDLELGALAVVPDLERPRLEPPPKGDALRTGDALRSPGDRRPLKLASLMYSSSKARPRPPRLFWRAFDETVQAWRARRQFLRSRPSDPSDRDEPTGDPGSEKLNVGAGSSPFAARLPPDRSRRPPVLAIAPVSQSSFSESAST